MFKKSNRPIIATSLLLLVAIIGLVFIRVGPVTADGQNDNSSITASSPPEPLTGYTSVVPSIVRLGLAMVVVIVCIYGGIFLLKKLSQRRIGGSRGQLLEVIETAGVGPKKVVTLVKVADRALVIGITDTNISLLTEFTAEQTAQILAKHETTVEPDRFAAVLKSVTSRIKEISFGRKHTALET
jgi:flagellar protein FliO/FliZ